MQVTRWKVVAVTATTAVLAGGALGVTNVLAGPEGAPQPIRLESIDVTARITQPTDDVLTPAPLSIVSDTSAASTATPGSTNSVVTPNSIVSPESPVTTQRSETSSTPSTTPTSPPPSAGSPDSPDSPSSVGSPSSIDS